MIEREPLAEAAGDILEGEARGEGDGRLAACRLAAGCDVAPVGGNGARACSQGLKHGADLRVSAA
jgi:hypothetical protein